MKGCMRVQNLDAQDLLRLLTSRELETKSHQKIDINNQEAIEQNSYKEAVAQELATTHSTAI